MGQVWRDDIQVNISAEISPGLKYHSSINITNPRVCQYLQNPETWKKPVV